MVGPLVTCLTEKIEILYQLRNINHMKRVLKKH